MPNYPSNDISTKPNTIFGPTIMEGEISSNDIDIFNSNLKHEISKTLFETWAPLISKDKIPQRKNFSIQKLHKIIPHILFAKYDEHESDWLVTNSGEGVNQLAGGSIIGKFLREIGSPEVSEQWITSASKLKSGYPYVGYFTLEFTNKEYIKVENLNLPIRDQEKQYPNMLIASVAVL